MKAEKDIRKEIKAIMEKKGATYDSVAKKCGCSKQAVWSGLNRRNNMEVRVARAELNAMGMDFYLYPLTWEPMALAAEDQKRVLEAAIRNRMQYNAFWEIMTALGIEIHIETTKKNRANV